MSKHYIEIKHLPTGETWQSVAFEDGLEKLHNLVSRAESLYIDTKTRGRFYFHPKVLEQCVVKIGATV